jgi:hypothetical protein
MIANIINVISIYKFIKSIYLDQNQDIQQILKWIFSISSEETNSIEIVYKLWDQKKLNRFQYIGTRKKTLEEIILLLIGLKRFITRSINYLMSTK